jgi:hypothetical protein
MIDKLGGIGFGELCLTQALRPAEHEKWRNAIDVLRLGKEAKLRLNLVLPNQFIECGSIHDDNSVDLWMYVNTQITYVEQIQSFVLVLVLAG